MWNDENEALRKRITNLSNEELLRMVNLDHEQYRKEALDYARAAARRAAHDSLTTPCCSRAALQFRQRVFYSSSSGATPK
jgi:hypothetical protein